MTVDRAYLEEIRPNWRRNWLICIAEFSDYELQRRSWLGGPEYDSPYWSFVEWMCRYFDDFSLSLGYAGFVNDGLVTSAEAKAVEAFHKAAKAYRPPAEDDYNHNAILADPAWQHVVALADAARQALLTIIQEPAERAILVRDAG